MTLIHTITKTDIGKGIIKKQCPTCGVTHILGIRDLMGPIQPIDVGKQIYRYKSGVLGVENQEQLEARIKPITTGLLVAWTITSILCGTRDQ